MAHTRFTPHLILGGVGAALTAAGVIAFTLSGPSFLGWYAYAPLGEEEPWLPTMFLQPGHVWGLVLGFAGAVLVSGVLGFRLGLRRRQ